MKKLLLLITVVGSLFSCVTQKPIETSVKLDLYEVAAYHLDLSKYAKDGIFISPEPYTGNFTPVAIVDISVTDGYTQEYAPVVKRASKPSSKNKGDDIYSKGTINSIFVSDYDIDYPPFKKFNINDLMDESVKKLKELGANGLVSIKIEQKQKGLRLTGFAILIP